MEKDSRYGWFLVFNVLIVHNLMVSGFTSFGVYLTEYLEFFRESISMTAWIGSLQMGTFGMTGIIGGGLVQRFGSRTMTIVGTSMMVVGYICSSQTHNIYLLGICVGIISGVGASFIQTSTLVIIQLYFDKKRTMAAAITSLGVGLSMLMWPALVRYLIDVYTWRGALLIQAAVILNNIPLGLTFAPFKSKRLVLNDNKNTFNSCKQLTKQQFVSERFKSFFGVSVCKNPVFLLFMSGSLAVHLSYTLNLSFIPARALSAGTDKYAAAFLISVLGFSNTLGRIFIAIIGDNKHVNLIVIYTLAAFGVGFFTFLIPFCALYVTLAVDVSLIGICLGVSMSSAPSLLYHLFGEKNLASVVGYFLAFLGAAYLFGPPLAGSIIDSTKSFSWCFIIFGSITVFGGIVLGLILPVKKLQIRSHKIATSLDDECSNKNDEKTKEIDKIDQETVF